LPALQGASGTASLNVNGEAKVVVTNVHPKLIDHLDNLVYNITPMGQAMPSLHLAETAQRHELGLQFALAGGLEGGRVSWHLTAPS